MVHAPSGNGLHQRAPQHNQHHGRPSRSGRRHSDLEAEDTMEEDHDGGRMMVEGRPWREVWYEFCQASSVGGLRQLVGSTPFTARRVIWLLLVLTGAALFVYQMLNSILYYRSWPVAVNVKVNHNETLRFPAVTLCNQNAFRMTVAANHNWYNTLSELYTDRLDSSALRASGLGNITMDTVHKTASHRREDFIVSCRWGHESCGPSDFDLTYTAQGVCYTFNSGRSGPVLNISRTGSNHGLRLLVNIEQYEYMPGPNEAAGIKMLLHDQSEAPLVEEFGLAVAPGSHAFAAILLLEVKKLSPPGGSCRTASRHTSGDDVSYSSQGCLLGCQAEAVRHRCTCWDFWFPASSQGGGRRCDLKSYHQCVLMVLRESRISRGRCKCPLPCHQVHFDPLLTHAAISRIGSSEFLLSANQTAAIHKRFSTAKESAERTVAELKSKNVDLVIDMSSTLEGISFALEKVDGQLVEALQFVEGLVEEVRPRIVFHQTRALKGVKYITQHNFIRGWEVMNQRTFDHVTTEFYETVSSYEKTASQLQQMADDQKTSRKIVYFMTDRDLSSKLEVAIRAVGNLTKAYYAYLNAEPLLQYTLTPDGRYDKYLIPNEVLAHNTRKQREYYNRMSEHLTGYIESILGLRYVLKDLNRNSIFNDTAYQECKTNFIFHAKKTNYYRSLFEQRIVHRSKELIELKVEHFDRIRHNFYSIIEGIKSLLKPLQASLREQYEGLQKDIVLFSQMSKTFLNSDSVKKEKLAAMANSAKTSEVVDSLKKLFSEIRSRGREMVRWWTRLEENYANLWRNFLKENSVRKFYTKLKEDIIEMIKYPDKRRFFLEIFSDVRMLHVDFDELNVTTVKNLTRMLNADLPDIGLKHKETDITMQFNRISSHAMFVDVLGDSDVRFLSAFDAFTKDLRNYEQETIIDKEFFRENFVRVDVFYRDLSYEVVEQSSAYSLTQLLSDIGGSLALFLGASALAVFEILDVIFHTMALKCYINRCQQRKSGAMKKISRHVQNKYEPGARSHEKIGLTQRVREQNGKTSPEVGEKHDKHMPRVAVTPKPSANHRPKAAPTSDDTVV